jgi:uncharacterized protein involved in exopolysaccharide biosynthesis
MNPREVLDRVRRERRWAVAFFLVSAALIAAVQFALAPLSHSAPARNAAPPSETP